MRHVGVRRPDYSDMLSDVAEVEWDITDTQVVDGFCVADFCLKRWWSKNLELRFLRCHLDLVFLAVLGCEMKQVAKLVDIMGEQDRVIRLSHTRDCNGANGDTELGVLSTNKLLVVVNFVLFRTIWSPLFDALFIMDWAHDGLLPLDEGDPVTKALV